MRMARCFLCQEDKDTRRVYIGRARGFESLCIDCMIRFFKLEQEQ